MIQTCWSVAAGKEPYHAVEKFGQAFAGSCHHGALSAGIDIQADTGVTFLQEEVITTETCILVHMDIQGPGTANRPATAMLLL